MFTGKTKLLFNYNNKHIRQEQKWGIIMNSFFATSITTLIMWLVILVVSPFITKKFWSFMVKKLFPRAVEENYVSENMSWPVAIVIGFIILGAVL